jgi:thymidylate kinase
MVVTQQDFARLFSVLSTVPGAVVAHAFVYQARSISFVLVAWSQTGLMTLTLDVSCEFRAAGRCFFTSDEILINRRRSPAGLWIPAPHMEFATYLLKRVLKSKRECELLSPHAQSRLSALFAAERTEAAWALRMFFSTELAQQVAVWVAANQWELVFTHRARLRRDALVRAFRSQPGSVVSYWMLEWRRIGYRLTHPTGLVIAVLGVDGAGKSQVCGSLPQRLASLFRRYRVFHYRPFWGRSFRRTASEDPYRGGTRGSVPSFFKLLYVWMDYWVSWIGVIAPAKARSTLIVFDRYFDDLYLDPARYRCASSRGLIRLFAKYAPRPDLFLILDAQVARLMQRRPLSSPMTAAALQASYARFAETERRAVVIANDRDVDFAVTLAAQEAIRCLARRWQGRLGIRHDGD